MESVPAPGQALASRCLVYTPAVANTPRTVDKGVTFYHTRLSWGIGLTLYPGEDHDALTGIGEANGPLAELLIVDEADRLKTPALEQLRDHHDRTGIGLILIGMPGIEKRLARYPPALQPGRIRPPLPAAIRPRASACPGQALARTGPRRHIGLHHQRGSRRDHPHHQRELPPDLPPRRPGPARPGHQPPLGRHQGSGRGSTRNARHRGHVRAQLPPSQAQIAHQEAQPDSAEDSPPLIAER
jgi:hypothetical protein